MPITRPWASSSGPPELPGLIAASVWITFVDREAVRRRDLALLRRHDPGGHRARVAERVADRHDGVADLDVGAVAERQRLELGVVGIDLEHRDVGRGVGADHLGVDEVAVLLEADLDVLGVADDVRVGDDRALLVDDEAGAGRLAAALGRAEGRVAGAGLLLGDHEDDAGALLLVDVGDGAGVAVVAAVRHVARRDALAHDAGRVVAGVDHVGGDQRGAEDQHDQAPKRPGQESWNR